VSVSNDRSDLPTVVETVMSFNMPTMRNAAGLPAMVTNAGNRAACLPVSRFFAASIEHVPVKKRLQMQVKGWP
jgi:hypothetical protein